MRLTAAATARSAAAPTSSGSSPTVPSIILFVGAVLVQQHDEWAEGRRYLGLDVLAKSQAVDTTREEVSAETTLQAITD